ncbi:MAG: 2-hydroxyacyl-CoA dehydratase, partial [Promethearchaeota archaeon]
SALRAVKDVPNVDYFEACVKAVQLDKESLLKELDDTIADWKGRGEFPVEKQKILLTGSDVTYKEWMELLDEVDMRVVRDDLSIGERFFATLIPEPGAGDDGPLDAIIKYHFNIPRPATKNPPDGRLDYLVNALETSGIRVVVSQNLKFCEPYAFDSVFTVNALKKKGYKVIHVEREFSPMKDLSMKTRLEAFREIQDEGK